MISDKAIEVLERVPHAAFGTFGNFLRTHNESEPPNGGDRIVQLHESDLEVLAAAIGELVEIARQSELTAATAAAETMVMANDWTPPPEPQPAELPSERATQLAAARARATKQERSPI